jgi:hypothetical protein
MLEGAMNLVRQNKFKSTRAKLKCSAAIRPLVESLEKRVLLSIAQEIATPSVIVENLSVGTDASSEPGFKPNQIQTAYGVNAISLTGGVTGNGAGETIAIVDAYNDPDIISDASTFCSDTGLTPFNGTGDPTLTVLNQNGGTTLPGNVPTTTNWDVEESLDVEWAHAIAPMANIVLFEANNANNSNLFKAVTTAADFTGVSVVSMSWGSSAEFSGEQSLDADLVTPANHQGVTFIAAAGDSGAIPEYPSVSPNVISVGGTSLILNANNTINSETAWSDGGGGISTMEPQPPYQVGKVNGLTTTNRATPDVSMVADPNTGVFVWDSYEASNPKDPVGPGLQVGGTSLSAPMWAALIAIANQGRALNGLSSMDGINQTLPTLYNLPSADFHDITSGNNGEPATVGYDLATGLGSPVANLLVPDLASLSGKLLVSGSTPSNGSSVFATPPTTFTIDLDGAVNPSTVAAGDLTVNGIAANSVKIDSTDTILTFQFTSSPVTTQGAQSISIAAGDFTRAFDGAPNAAFNASFNYANTQLQVTSTNPAAGSDISPPVTTLDINFNKAVNPATVNVNDLSLSQGTVTGFLLLNGNTTVAYTLSGVSSVGSLNVSMAAGAVDDTFGTPMAAFSESINLEVVAATITAVSPNPRTAPVTSMTIVFGQAVTGLSLSGLNLTDNGGPNLLTGSQTLTTSDGITWTLGNLGGITAAAGSYTLSLAAGAAQSQSSAGVVSAAATQSWQMNSTIAARSIFYNDSIFNGDEAGGTANDLNAVAPDKTALLPGGTATYANMTDYSKGINGLIIEISNLPTGATLSPSDFQFATGDVNDTTTWTPLATAPTVTQYAGTGGVTDVDLTWANGTITNTWLQITVLADANTGLAANDVSYFGNLIGKVVDSGSPEQVTALDLSQIESNIVGTASITDPYDVNKDGTVDAEDLVLTQKNSFSAIRLITPTGNGPAVQIAAATTVSPSTSVPPTTVTSDIDLLPSITKRVLYDHWDRWDRR